MKRIFSVLTICSLLAMPVLAANPRLAARDVHLVKKARLGPAVGAGMEEVKGNPHSAPPGQDKDKGNGASEEAATGTLGEPATGNKYAVLIGICDYPGTKNDIGDCKSDGDSLNMYKALTTFYGYDPDNIRLFKDMGTTTGFVHPDTGENIIAGVPSYSNIRDAVMDIKDSAITGDEVVFFFSGHGVDGIARDNDKERRDEGILVHKDNASDLDSDYDFIWDGEIKTWFSGFATQRIVFVFDSCLAGGMNDAADIGRVVVMSTSESQVAYVYSTGTGPDAIDVDGDGVGDGEGVFTHYFANEGILQGLADIYDHDDDTTFEESNDVAVEEAFDYANEIVPSGWKRQKPTISDKFEDDLLL